MRPWCPPSRRQQVQQQRKDCYCDCTHGVVAEPAAAPTPFTHPPEHAVHSDLNAQLGQQPLRLGSRVGSRPAAHLIEAIHLAQAPGSGRAQGRRFGVSWARASCCSKRDEGRTQAEGRQMPAGAGGGRRRQQLACFAPRSPFPAPRHRGSAGGPSWLRFGAPLLLQPPHSRDGFASQGWRPCRLALGYDVPPQPRVCRQAPPSAQPGSSARPQPLLTNANCERSNADARSGGGSFATAQRQGRRRAVLRGPAAGGSPPLGCLIGCEGAVQGPNCRRVVIERGMLGGMQHAKGSWLHRRRACRCTTTCGRGPRASGKHLRLYLCSDDVIAAGASPFARHTHSPWTVGGGASAAGGPCPTPNGWRGTIGSAGELRRAGEARA